MRKVVVGGSVTCEWLGGAVPKGHNHNARWTGALVPRGMYVRRVPSLRGMHMYTCCALPCVQLLSYVKTWKQLRELWGIEGRVQYEGQLQRIYGRYDGWRGVV